MPDRKTIVSLIFGAMMAVMFAVLQRWANSEIVAWLASAITAIVVAFAVWFTDRHPPPPSP
jgi:hypothetical protein